MSKEKLIPITSREQRLVRNSYNQALKDAQEQCRKEFMDDRWEIIPTLFLIRIHCVGCIKGLEKQEGK